MRGKKLRITRIKRIFFVYGGCEGLIGKREPPYEKPASRAVDRKLRITLIPGGKRGETTDFIDFTDFTHYEEATLYTDRGLTHNFHSSL